MVAAEAPSAGWAVKPRRIGANAPSQQATRDRNDPYVTWPSGCAQYGLVLEWGLGPMTRAFASGGGVMPPMTDELRCAPLAQWFVPQARDTAAGTRR